MLYVLNMTLFLIGLFIIIRESNLIKKVIGLDIGEKGLEHDRLQRRRGMIYAA